MPLYPRILPLISHCVLCGVAIFTLTILPAHQLHAASCESVARLVSLEGTIEYKTANTENWTPAVLEQEFCNGDAIRSGRDSRAALRMINETLLRLDHSTAIIFTSVVQKERSLLDLLKGALHFISRVPRSLEVNTPYLNAAIEGTEFVIKVQDESTEVTVYEGKVVASNASGSINLSANQAGSAASGQAPIRMAVARPRDAVAWTLYYPPLPAQQDKADKLAQQTIDAIVRNDIAQAATLAKQALTSNPQSAAAYMAQSYVDQARFDIPAALENSRRATELAQQDAITQARLAEVLLMTGDTNTAKKAATKAVQIDPTLAHTQIVLGFSSLQDVNLDDAESAFNQAIKLDSAAPLARLGLGLVKIRRGDLKAGREEIETAVLLDPNSALLRSYMGKAYYEEKRNKLASEQFAMAKELDPNDPTAWFYDSILLQSENRPVEALLTQQQAVALNDNRGVYRSRQLLDRDEAARNTASARIYSDLGFEKLAISQGARALAQSPDNFSAHRFMADINSTQPQRSRAVDSDLLQSKLLQPLNAHTLRPQLSELQLSDGPGRFSYNEFNPLFTTSGPTLLLNGLVAENNTWGEDLIASYLHERFSVSLGQYHYESDGFREIDHLEKDTLTGFVQFDITTDTMIQFEFMDDEQKNGDLNQHFFSEANSSEFEEETRKDIGRLGLRHNFSNQSTLLVNYSYAKFDTDNITDLITTGKNKEKFSDTGIQWLISTGDTNFVFGGDYFDQKDDLDIIISPPGFPASVSTLNANYQFNNVYLYSYSSITPELQLTLASSYSGDKIERQFENNYIGSFKNNYKDSQFNPKIGVVWDVSENSTIRVAVFRDKPLIVATAILEPTQIAGFNQIYDDFQSDSITDVLRAGVGFDTKINPDLWFGVSVLYSDLKGRVFGLTSDDDETFDMNRELLSAYLNYKFNINLILNIEYEYEKFESPELALTLQDVDINSLKTHKMPVTIQYNYSNYLNASITGTYYEQDGIYNATEEGKDNFWIFDSSISYALPSRTGKLSLGIKNLFDTEFNYEDKQNNTLFTPDQSSNINELSPERIVYAKFSINF